MVVKIVSDNGRAFLTLIRLSVDNSGDAAFDSAFEVGLKPSLNNHLKILSFLNVGFAHDFFESRANDSNFDLSVLLFIHLELHRNPDYVHQLSNLIELLKVPEELHWLLGKREQSANAF